MEILIIVFLILLNGTFSMSEIALVSARKFRLEGAAKKGHKNAEKALKLAENPNTFLSTVQIGITLIGILTGVLSADSITEEMARIVGKIALLAPYADSIAVALVVIIITYLSIVFGELLPKRIGLRYPEKIAFLVASPMELISKVAKPFIWLLGKTNDLFLGLFGIKEAKEEGMSEEEINSIIYQSTKIGEVQEIEHDIVKRVFVLGDRKVRELMTHRIDLIWFDIHDGLETIREQTRGQEHSVYPVADRDLDKLAGVFYLKELFARDFCNTPFKLADHIKKPVFVHENLPVYKLLEQLKSKNVESAIVVDEYGSIEGIITIYDVFDALVGDTVDTGFDEKPLVQRDENSWLADGQLSYYELVSYFGIEEDESEEVGFTTLAGLLLYLLNHIPVAGEKVSWKAFEFEIMDMDDRRIDKVLISRKTS